MSTKGHGAPRYVGTNAERVALATGGLVAGVLWVETDTLDIYTWDGTAWQTGSGLFLELDASNDPVTAGLEVNAATLTEPVLILQTTDDDATNPTLEVQDSAGVVLTSITSGGDPTVGKVSGRGIRVDTTTPTFGWRDLLGAIRTRGVGATDPNDATYRGNIKGYQFDVNDEAWIEFHVPHDYVAGSDVHLHFHWSHNSAIVTGGTVTWGADLTYAKGHNQAAFPAPVNPTVIGTASTTQYQHIITEVQVSASTPSAVQIDSDDLEPDGLILARVYLGANNITSSGAVPDPFLHFADIHYQTTNIGTKQKAPDFYT